MSFHYYNYYNIYSEAYIGSLMPSMDRVKNWTVQPDVDFDRQRILASMSDHQGAHDASGMVGDYQVNGYILQPWSILEITL